MVLAILLLLVLSLIGMSAINTTSFNNAISGNKRISEDAFNVAEAGIQEFLGRFREGATGEVADTEEDLSAWRLYIAQNQESAAAIGYSPGNPNHHFYQSLQNRMDFGIELRHKVNIANAVIKKSGHPAYRLISHGFTQEGGKKLIEAELNRSPDLDPDGALYSERPVNIHGSSTYIQGMDACGSNHVAGIAVTLSSTPTDPITTSGHPTIQGDPPAQYSAENRSLRDMIDYLKRDANFTYDYNSNQTLTGYSDLWGIPSGSGTETALTYTGPMNIIYFNMHGKTLKLSGGSHGAGILLVDGHLDLNGGFKWYGLVVVIGALDYTGGGNKNITGGVMAGESATIQVDVGGNAGIINCSDIANRLKDKVTPVKLISWREVY